MSSVQKWKPGDVAAMPDGGRAIVAEADEWGRRFIHEDGQRRHGDPRNGAGPRRLAVIDPEDREQVERLCKVLVERMHRAGDMASAANGVHPATVTAALREFANPVVKPEEPTGLGAVVFAACECSRDRKRFVRNDTGSDFSDYPWKSGCGHHKWSDLDVRDADDVLQKGLTD